MPVKVRGQLFLESFLSFHLVSDRISLAVPASSRLDGLELQADSPIPSFWRSVGVTDVHLCYMGSRTQSQVLRLT